MNGKYSLADLFSKMQPNQAIFVHHLRTNPHAVEQIAGNLVSDSAHMCALGLGLEAFDMIKEYEASQKAGVHATYDPYEEIAEVLQMPEDHVSGVYSLNDDYNLSFEKIADVMEDYFSQDSLFSLYFTRSPVEVYENIQEKETEERRQEFSVKWEEAQREYHSLMNKLARDLDVESSELVGTIDDWDGSDFFDEFVGE